ncbi:MAG: class I SAM-dependent methyltransferase [Betaproteobacteria bacterium]|nr:class I SAM-dependent methyltransferase [Betaproteobacteria bacterium]
MHRLKLVGTRIFAALLAAAAFALPTAAAAQNAAKDYTPHVGQEGKDVIWVPTPQALVERMLDMAKLTANDIHYDLGSGDGRTVITAAKRGAQAFGVEYNPDMVALSERAAAKEGVADKVKFIRGDIFETDFTRATVLTLYLLPSLNVKLRPTILRMKPGTRVVSHAFSMDDWQPDQTANVEGRTAYLWIVPAPVEGTWRWSVSGPGPRNYELALRQQYQQVEGLARLDGKMGQLRDVKLQGDRISFSIHEITGTSGTVRRDFTGRVSGNTLQGVMKLPDGAGEVKWSATRVD